MNWINFIYVVFILFLISCENEEPVDSNTNFEYPATFNLTGYSYETPQYYVYTSQNFEETSPSSGFAQHVQYLIDFELDEVADYFPIRSMTFINDTVCILDLLDNDTGLVSQVQGDLDVDGAEVQIHVNSYNIELTVSEDRQTLNWCENIFSYTITDPITSSTEYQGFDFYYCFLLGDNPIDSYNELIGNSIQPFDTIVTINLNRLLELE
ncbi:MAG: hypothetical protein R2795_02830 [Saprospiraceae bacterium]